MKSGRLFWGTVFLGAGAFLLLNRFELLPGHLSLSWRWWPLVLVFFGFAILTRNVTAKTASIVLAALVFSSIASGIFHLPWTRDNADRDRSSRQLFSEPFDEGIRSAVMKVEFDAGTLTVGHSDSDLVRASIESGISSFGFRSDRLGDRIEIDIIQQEREWRPRGKVRNDIDILLRDGPAWQLHVDAGAADLHADLIDLRMESVTIEAVAAAIHLTLGSVAPKCLVRIDAGASSITVRVPTNAGCEIEIDSGWSDIQIPGFNDLGSGRYRTENSDTASSMILVTFDSGASSIQVDRY